MIWKIRFKDYSYFGFQKEDFSPTHFSMGWFFQSFEVTE